MSDPLLDDLDHVVDVMLRLRSTAKERGDHQLRADCQYTLEKMASHAAELRYRQRMLYQDDVDSDYAPEIPY